jgi:hypothetical protein
MRSQLDQLEANRRRWDDYTDDALLADPTVSIKAVAKPQV